MVVEIEDITGDTNPSKSKQNKNIEPVPNTDSHHSKNVCDCVYKPMT